MKKLLLLVACVMMSMSVGAQDTTGVYYNNAPLEYSRIIGKNVGNIAGAYLTFGLSSAKSSKVIEGGSAELGIKDKQPEFTIVFGEDKKTEYIFTNERNIGDLFLIQLHKKKGKRELLTGKYGLSGVKVGLNEEDVRSLSIERVGDGRVKVQPKSPLKKGEYCFYYIGEAPSESTEFNGVFDFSIE